MEPDPRPKPDQPAAEPAAEEAAQHGTGDGAWWWSPGLMVVVGVVVIGFQVQAYTGDGGTVLNAIMIAIGAAVAGTGVVQLWRARPR